MPNGSHAPAVRHASAILSVSARALAQSARALAQSARALAQSARALAQSARALAQSARALAQSARALAQSARALAQSARALARPERRAGGRRKAHAGTDRRRGLPGARTEADDGPNAATRRRPSAGATGTGARGTDKKSATRSLLTKTTGGMKT